eukprot:g1314.t1
MKHVAAYLLESSLSPPTPLLIFFPFQAVLGGNQHPSAKDIEKILDSVGVDVDSTKLKQLLSELEGKDIHEVICAGREKMASVPTGGVAVASGGTAAAGGPAAAAEEEKPEEKEEEESEEDEVST